MEMQAIQILNGSNWLKLLLCIKINFLLILLSHPS